MKNWVIVSLMALMLCQTVGCGNGDIIVPPQPRKKKKKEADKPKTVVKKPRKTRKFIRLDVPVMLESPGYLAFIDVAERGKVLKIKSSPDVTDDSYPAYYFHAQVETERLVDLMGTDIGVTAFVRHSKEAGTWTNAADKPILIQLTPNKDLFNVKIIGGQMANSLTGEVSEVSGEFVCVRSSK